MLHAGPHSPLVHRDHALKMLAWLIGGVRGRHLNAGIVEGHVEPAVFRDRAVYHRGHLRLVGHVAGNADCVTALVDDPFGLLRGEIAVQVGQHDGGAARGKQARRRKPHAFGGAGDQGNLAFEIVDRIHRTLRFSFDHWSAPWD